MSDEAAGWVFGIHNMLASVYGLLLGFAIDNMGVRASLVLGAVITTASRLVLAFAHGERLVLAILYSALPVGCSLGIPVMQIGIRRFTNDENRSIAFSLFYVCMNVAAMLAAQAVDVFRAVFPVGILVPHFGTFSSFRLRLRGPPLLVSPSSASSAAGGRHSDS